MGSPRALLAPTGAGQHPCPVPRVGAPETHQQPSQGRPGGLAIPPVTPTTFGGDKDTQESAEDSQSSHEYGHVLDPQPEPSLANSRVCTQRYPPQPDNHTDPVLTTVPPRSTSPPAERCGQVSVGTEGTSHLLPAGKVQVGEAAEGEDRAKLSSSTGKVRAGESCQETRQTGGTQCLTTWCPARTGTQEA